jgi:hypothetical protein
VGFTAVGLLELFALFTLNVAAEQGGWSSFGLRLGPLLFFAFERTTDVATLTLGGGLLLVAALGGGLNAGGAALLQRRV